MTDAKSPEGVLAFTHIFTPRARAQGKDPDFSLCIIFDEQAQKSPAYANLRRAVADAIDAKWPGKSKDAAFVKRLNLPFKNAADKSQYDGFREGGIYIQPWTKIRPGVVSKNLEDIIDKDEVWAGQLGRVAVNAFAWENSGKMGVSFGLNHVQITKKDMPRIDGRKSASKVFDDELSDVTGGETEEALPF